MYHGGKIRSRAALQPNRDLHAAHPVHLTLNANVNSPSGERQMRYIIPDRLTRDQATTFRPSDLPIGQSSRKSSAHSDALSNHNFLTGPVKNIAGFGPPVGTQYLSMGESKPGANGTRRSICSSPKNYANEDSTYLNGYNTGKLPPQKNFTPGEKVLFAESSSSPGVPIAYRSTEEKSSNPDRLNLDRRNLTVCPILEGEDFLRLLNFQHNLITRIQNLSNLKRLIFLDLYDNKIEDMSGLSTLRSLRVLMLGKNRIEKISGLENLVKLDVLDLHGNQIRVIENLNQLCELRVLNLAGNQLECVSNLTGMDTLAELNLRRNNISTINQIDLLPSLLRLFLSFNDIERWSDVECLGESTSLLEITLDGNPLTSEISYKQIVIKNISQLRQLDMKRITDEERRVAALMLKKEEDRRRENHRQSLAKEKKRLAISNAAMRWKAEFPFNKVNTSIKNEHKQTTDLTEENTESDKTKTQEKKWTDEGGGSWLSSVAVWATSQYKNNLPLNAISLTSMDVSQSFLAEIENDNLFLFGPKSLESLDKNWGNQISASVNAVTIQFIYFDDVSSCFEKLRQRFPNITSLVLKECGLSSFRQLNTITQMKKLTSLTIDEGTANPLTQFTLWKYYALYRLVHLSLTTLNGNKISESEVLKSEKIFGCLSLATTSNLSQYRLSALCNQNATSKPHTNITPTLGSGTKEAGKKKAAATTPSKESITDTSLPTEPIGKSALQYTPSKLAQADNLDRQIRHSVSREVVGEICSNVCDIATKQTQFFHLWPRIFIEMVAEAVLEMKDTEAYIRREANEFYCREWNEAP